jgi:hypothetical protein
LVVVKLRETKTAFDCNGNKTDNLSIDGDIEVDKEGSEKGHKGSKENGA